MDAGERQRLIESRKEDRNRTERLWARDGRKEFSVWKVPVEGLLFNIDNLRMSAERKLIEDKLGHNLDPETNPDDEISIISILLDTGLKVFENRVTGTPSKDYKALKKDWIARKQDRPIWIRPDGIVRNGNRRLAMLKRFQVEQGLEGFEFVEAIILGDDIDEQTLFEMEQHEQLTTDFKVQYTDVNRLIAIREAAITHKIDWADRISIENTAGLIQHVAGEDAAYALRQLQAIKAMDDFLADENASGKYYKLMRQVERFRDVGTTMWKIEDEYPDDAPDMMRLLFASVRAGITNYQIRDVRRIFIGNRTQYETLLGAIDEAEATWVQETEHELSNPDLDLGGDNAEEEDSETPGPVVPNYPAKEVKRILENAIDGFKASSGLDVLSLLEQALSRLDTLTDDDEKLSAAIQSESAQEIRALLERVIAWAESVKPILTPDE